MASRDRRSFHGQPMMCAAGSQLLIVREHGLDRPSGLELNSGVEMHRV